MTNKLNNLILYPYSKNLSEIFELNYIEELREINKINIIKLRCKYINESKKKDKTNDTQIWLINDRNNKAGENGAYFFRYLQTIKPKGIKFYFVIQNNCSDYERLNIYDNIIVLNSRKYINLFFKVDKIISSISQTWIYNPFNDNGKYICDLFKFDLIILQNSIIKDDLTLFMNSISIKFDLILSSSIKEYKSLLSPNYGYFAFIRILKKNGYILKKIKYLIYKKIVINKNYLLKPHYLSLIILVFFLFWIYIHISIINNIEKSNFLKDILII